MKEFSNLSDRCRDWQPDLAIVTGSGLASLGGGWGFLDELPWLEIPEIPPCGVSGHTGSFVLTQVGEHQVLISKGRIHLYEGHDAQAVTTPVRALSEIGVPQLILTNAAGAIHPDFKVGNWMLITDHLNLTGESPLRGSTGFIDMTRAWCPELQRSLRKAATEADITLHEGVYAGLRGPQFETPAEIRMLRTLGSDAVGMSTVLECIQARALGMQVAGFSCLTNPAAGLSEEEIRHEDVLSIGQNAASEMDRLLECYLV